MRKILPALLGVCMIAQASAATLYISDELAVPLRRGPSNGHRILHAGLPSGMPLEVLGEDKQAGFTHVRTPSGLEGWAPTQYLTAQPIARDRLAAANERIKSLEAQLKSVRENYQEARGERSDLQAREQQLQRQNEQLQTEIAEIRRVSATAIAHYEENNQLKAANQALAKQAAQLEERVRQLERSMMLRSALAGGGLVIAGVLLGVWLKSRRKRSVWS
ncbi:MAG TPA: TIGR04211 family SH3 domain-containing protein [Steroidobacter sp.]|nr:TIGR04211 family SH3 domain-containing protein [Steroidobacter sp.]